MISFAGLKKILATARPRFLLLTPCCLSIALAMAIAEPAAINGWHLILILIGALSGHASVNLFNEYGDFSSGLDFRTQRTAFSGGTGVLPTAPELAKSVYIAALVTLALTMAIGIYLVWICGWGLLPLGLAGVMLIYFYTQTITHRPLLCLVAPGLAFGPLMIDGTYYVLRGHYSSSVLFVSLIVFFLVNDLLLLNQFPDLEADRLAGRHHLPISIGRKRSARVYAWFLIAAYGILTVSVWLSWLPLLSLSGLATLALAIPAARRAVEHCDDIENLIPALALNVGVTLLTPLLVSAGIVVQSIFEIA